MRVIAGEYGGRTLFAPPGVFTRPTADRAREALFSILGGKVPDAKVLDIFAGSGAMAMEAISRGAAGAVMIDSDAGAQAAIRRNIAALGLGERASLLCLDYRKALASLKGRRFTLAFADPPYARLEYYAEVMELLWVYRLLTPGATLVLEHAKAADIRPDLAYELTDSRRYGDTILTILRYRGVEGSDEGVRDTGQF